MESIAVEHLSFRYPGAAADTLRDVRFRVEAGEFVVLIGATGSGKSTLLRLLKRELAPLGERRGDVRLGGVAIESLSERDSAARVGYVMQRPEQQLVTDKVWHELAFALENLGVPQPAIRRRVAEMASYFGIADWFERDVHSLSGGQKQLLNLAAAMVAQPEVLLLDEPTSQLDPIAASDFLNTVRKLNREMGLTVLLIEHRLEEALPMADRVLVLEDGQLSLDLPPAQACEQLRGHPALLEAMPGAVRLFHAVHGAIPATSSPAQQKCVPSGVAHSTASACEKTATVDAAHSAASSVAQSTPSTRDESAMTRGEQSLACGKAESAVVARPHSAASSVARSTPSTRDESATADGEQTHACGKAQSAVVARPHSAASSVAQSTPSTRDESATADGEQSLACGKAESAVVARPHSAVSSVAQSTPSTRDVLATADGKQSLACGKAESAVVARPHSTVSTVAQSTPSTRNESAMADGEQSIACGKAESAVVARPHSAASSVARSTPSTRDVLAMASVEHSLVLGRTESVDAAHFMTSDLDGRMDGRCACEELSAIVDGETAVEAGRGCPITVREGRRFLRENFRNDVRALERQERPRPEARALELRNVYFRYGREQADALRGLELDVRAGEILCLLGPNGSGKSTALRLAAGLARPYSGDVRVFGKRLRDYRGQSLYRNCVAMLPQDAQTVFLKSTVREELREVGCDAAALPYALDHLMERHPYDLSGGEQQLVALAKVLASKPKLLLLDEPTKGVDAHAKRKVMQILRRLRDSSVAVLVVTHDVEFAALCADRCALLFRGELVSSDAPARFFDENSFYTTAANRICRGWYDGVATVEDAAELCRRNERRS